VTIGILGTGHMGAMLTQKLSAADHSVRAMPAAHVPFFGDTLFEGGDLCGQLDGTCRLMSLANVSAVRNDSAPLTVGMPSATLRRPGASIAPRFLGP
jgi:hypothetical protein